METAPVINSSFVCEELFNCSICYEKSEKGKLLTCLHTFCQLCLERHYGLGMPRCRVKKYNVISCPNCRELTVMSRGIDGLPDDPAIAKMRIFLTHIQVLLKSQQVKQTLASSGGAFLQQTVPYVSTEGLGGVEGTATESRAAAFRQELAESEITESDISQSGVTVKDLQILQDKFRERMLLIHEEMLNLAAVELNNIEEKPTFMIKKSKRKKTTVVKEEYSPLLARLKRLQDNLYVINANLKVFSLVTDEVLKLNSETIDSLLVDVYDIGRRVLNEQNTKFDHSQSVYKNLVQNDENQKMTNTFGNEATTTVDQRRFDNVTDNDSKNKFKSPIRFDSIKVTLKWRIGERGTLPGKFEWPVDVAFASDRILVADKNNRRVQIFDFNGCFISSIGRNDIAPKRIVVNGSEFHVSDELGLCVKVVNDSSILRSWGEGRFTSPCGFALDSEKEFVMSDAETGKVSVFNSHFDQTSVFKTRTPADLSVPNPYFIATNSDDQIIVSDSYNNCVKIFAKTGQLLLSFGRGLLSCPRGVCLDSEGNILVVDSDNHKVRLFDGYGQYKFDLLTRADGITFPMAVDIQNSLILITQCGFYGGHELRMYELNVV